jgi:hypothetical protein
MFTERHEQELAEIKALTHQLRDSFEEIVEQLGRIQAAQDRLAAEGPPAAAPGKRRKPRTKAKKRPGTSDPATLSADSDEG